MSTSMMDAVYQFVFSAATVALIVTFISWLRSRYDRWITFTSQGKGKVFVREPYRLQRRFLGRTAELTALKSAVADNTPAVVVGTAGIGKTTLGLALAEELRAWGCRLVWLSCTEETNLEAVLDTLSLHLKAHYQEEALREAFEKTQAHDATQWIDVLADCLHGSEYVLFVDDQYLVEDRIVTTELLPRLSTCAKVVILTREITPDLRVALQSMARPCIVQLAGLSDENGLAVLHEAGLADEPRDLMLQFVRRVDGHPKALEVGAGLVKDRAHGLTLVQLVSQNMLGKDPSQPLMTMLRASDKRLSRRERAFMVACATVYESFSTEEICAIYGDPRSEPLLNHLLNRSLIGREQDDFHSLHPLIREYYQILGQQMLSTKWGALYLPRSIARFLFRSFLPIRDLNRHFHAQAAEYYRQHAQDSPRDKSRIIQHLEDSYQYRQAATEQGIILEIRKHPTVAITHLWILTLAIGCVLCGFFALLPLLNRTGWSWVGWLNARKSLLAASLTVIVLVGWLGGHLRMIRYSWLIVTHMRTVYVFNQAWHQGRLLGKRRRWFLLPARSLWRMKMPFRINDALRAKPCKLPWRKHKLGYIMLHDYWRGESEQGQEFGPVLEPEQRLAEICQALDADSPSRVAE